MSSSSSVRPLVAKAWCRPRMRLAQIRVARGAHESDPSMAEVGEMLHCMLRAAARLDGYEETASSAVSVVGVSVAITRNAGIGSPHPLRLNNNALDCVVEVCNRSRTGTEGERTGRRLRRSSRPTATEVSRRAWSTRTESTKPDGVRVSARRPCGSARARTRRSAPVRRSREPRPACGAPLSAWWSSGPHPSRR